MQEIVVTFIILATLAVAYLWIYPTFAGNDVRRIQIYDVFISLAAFGIVASIYMGDDLRFTFLFFETNWVVFTVLTALVAEFPLFYWYLKARGLTQAYFESSTRIGNVWGTSSTASVTRQLNDEKWNGLRTRNAKLFLLITSNVSILGGTVFLSVVGDGPAASYSLIHVLLIGVFWFLLTRSARLIGDAPDDALDERLIQLRDRAYLLSYRGLSLIVTLALIAVMVFVIVRDSAPESDGFTYLISITWPQVQAFWWLFLSYAILLPSMSVLALDIRQTSQRSDSGQG